MRLRMVLPAAVLCLAAPAFLRAAPTPVAGVKPAVVVTLKSIDGLLADAKYLAELAGKGDDFKQYEGMIKSLAGPKGIEGLDTKKPIGFYARFDAKDIEKSEAVGLIPVADEAAVIDLIKKNKDAKVEKGDDGIYTVTSPTSPFPIYFLFTNKYAYVTGPTKNALAKDRLLAPEAVLAPDSSSLLSLVLRVDQIPDKYKELALDAIQTGVEQAKDQAPPGETEAQKKARLLMTDEMAAFSKTVIKEGGELTLRFDVDRKAGELSSSVSFGGLPGSKLAKSIADLGARKSVSASLVGSDSAFNMIANLSLSQGMRKAFHDAFNEGFQKSLDEEKDKGKREVAEAFRKAIEPTLKTGEIDGGFDFRGPNAKGLYTIVMGFKVQDGASIEKVFRDAVKDMPEKDREKLTIDFAKAGAVGIHKFIGDDKDLDENFRKMIGDKPVGYFAFRDDAVLWALGEDGLAAIKDAIAAKPKPGALFQMEMGMGRMAIMLGKDQPAAVDAAKKAFKDKDKDKFRIALEGGKTLQARMSMDAQLVTFFAEIAEAQMKAEKEKDK